MPWFIDILFDILTKYEILFLFYLFLIFAATCSYLFLLISLCYKLTVHNRGLLSAVSHHGYQSMLFTTDKVQTMVVLYLFSAF